MRRAAIRVWQFALVGNREVEQASMNTRALGIDLGPLPERPLDPPDPGTAPDLRGEASAAVLREAKDLNWWIALFDDAENVDDIDVVALASAMHAAHCGHDETALDTLREAAATTVAALSAQEAEEREKDRLEALEEDSQEWKRERAGAGDWVNP